MVAVTQDNIRTKNGWNTDMVIVPSVLAATATMRQPLFVAPVNIELGEVALVNSTIVTGHASNTKNLNLVDGGAEGAGTAEIANRDMGSGTDLIVGKTLLFDNIQGASAEFNDNLFVHDTVTASAFYHQPNDNLLHRHT